MKKIKYNRKPIFFISLLIVLILFGMTFAVFYSELTIPNEFRAASYKVVIEEEDFEDDFGAKKVFIANNETTNAPVVVRVNYDEVWSKTSNNVIELKSNKVGNSDVVNKTWTTAFERDFVLIDGWYYYKKVLSPNERVQILSSISLNNNISNISEYDDYDYKLAFNFEAVQASTDAISEVWGKNVTITGSNVTWQ